MTSQQKIPSDAPPAYDDVVGGASSSRPQASGAHSSRLQVPRQSSSNGIPAAHRRSMEDESRPLPPGWVRSFDPQNKHQFFVDTTKDPPRSIWHHPHDDDQYLATLSSEQRERIEQESMQRGAQASKLDILNAHSDDDDGASTYSASSHARPSSSAVPDELPPRPDAKDKGKAPRSLGRKFKDKMTGSTHEERVAERRRREEQERRQYESHMRLRQAMAEAAQTGRPVLLGKDPDGKDVVVNPPAPDQDNYGGPNYGGPSYGYSYNPYGDRSGVWTTPSARYITPQQQYSRPAGGGFGGGYGLPLALGGGLLGGLLLGDMLAGPGFF